MAPHDDGRCERLTLDAEVLRVVQRDEHRGLAGKVGDAVRATDDAERLAADGEDLSQAEIEGLVSNYVAVASERPPVANGRRADTSGLCAHHADVVQRRRLHRK